MRAFIISSNLKCHQIYIIIFWFLIMQQKPLSSIFHVGNKMKSVDSRVGGNAGQTLRQGLVEQLQTSVECSINKDGIYISFGWEDLLRLNLCLILWVVASVLDIDCLLALSFYHCRSYLSTSQVDFVINLLPFSSLSSNELLY